MPALVQLNASSRKPVHRHRRSPIPRCCRSTLQAELEDAAERTTDDPVALPGRLQSRRSVPRRARRLRRGIPAAAGRGRGCRAGPTRDRSKCRSRDRCSSMTSPIRQRQGRACQVAGVAISGHAPLHPRRLCALRLHPFWRAVRRLDPVPRFGAAGAPARLPRGLPDCGALPEGVAHGGRPAVAAAHDIASDHRRAADWRCRQTSPITRAATSSPGAAAPAVGPATPTSPPIRRSAFRWRVRPWPPSAHNPSRGATRRGLSPASIRGATISARHAASMSGNAPQVSATRDRISGRAPAPPRRTAKAVCDDRRQPSSPCATVSSSARQAAGRDIADQHTQRAHPLPLHAHEPVSDGRRRHAQRPPRRRGRTDRRGLELSRPAERHQPPSALRHPGVHARWLALGQSLHHAGHGL